MVASCAFALCSIEDGSDFAPWKTSKGELDETLGMFIFMQEERRVCSNMCFHSVEEESRGVILIHGRRGKRSDFAPW